MYIIKNAFKNIINNKGKSLLIGIIIFVIGLSCTLALSIKEASNTAYQEGLADLNISANISFDRQSMMQEMSPPDNDSTDQSSGDNREMMKEAMSNQGLDLDELESYSENSNVKDFYYTQTLSISADDNLQKIESENNGMSNGKMGDNSLNSGDFTLIGYSKYDAMTSFVSGASTISEGELFENDATNECIISEDLATYNSISINDTITLVNPNNSEETYTLKVTGIYNNSETNTIMGRGMSDPANQIYTSVKAVNAITSNSETIEANTTNDTVLSSSVNGTYTFANVENYEAFSEEVYDMGLDESYIVNSSDITNYENSLAPLNNLASYANTFLIVILVVGSLILIVFNILKIKERKYEIGVLSAIGMNKKKISIQFISELFMITFISLILSIGIGSVSSVPLTNSLLANSETTTTTFESQMNNKGGMNMDHGSQEMPASNQNYIESVSSATDFSVIIELLGIGLILSILSGGIATLTILRYEPLKILSNQE